MAEKIGGYGGRGLDISSARTRAPARPEQAADGSRARAAGEPANDRLSLTGTATVLKKAEARLAALPDVDQARVERLRQRLADGSYQVNPERVAGRLAEFERLLG